MPLFQCQVASLRGKTTPCTTTSSILDYMLLVALIWWVSLSVQISCSHHTIISNPFQDPSHGKTKSGHRSWPHRRIMCSDHVRSCATRLSHSIRIGAIHRTDWLHPVRSPRTKLSILTSTRWQRPETFCPQIRGQRPHQSNAASSRVQQWAICGSRQL